MVKLRHLSLDGSQAELWQPDSAWEPYAGPLPRLSGVDVAIDTETRDDGLANSVGPGWVHDRGHLCGVSVAHDGGCLYVPVRHPDTACRPLPEVLEWVDYLLRDCTCHFFNAGFDLGWLRQAGLRGWPRRMHDASISAVMLDENEQTYSLDDCCARAGVVGKDTTLLNEAARACGVDPKSGMWRMPARFVGPYAEQDAASTLVLSQHNLRRLEEEGQLGAYQTEIDLVRVVHDMRSRGIRISESAAEHGQQQIRLRRDTTLEEIRRQSGWRVDMKTLRSPDALGKLFQESGIHCPMTPKSGKASVTREWLAGLDHPLGHLVRQARQFDDLADKFIGTYILGHAHRGRIHAEVHQLRDESGGTRTHRLSYSNPPLQQTPTRADPKDLVAVEQVQLVRDCFLPEDGEIWFAPDMASQEPRLLVHLAAACGIPSGEDMARRYQENPRLDYHSAVAEIVGLPRKQAKDCNQALAYGIGVPKLARILRVPESEAAEIVRIFHQRLPYVRRLAEHCETMAKSRGWIRLLDGARMHYDSWQSVNERTSPVKGASAAKVRWPNAQLERAFCHKAMNGAVQGGSARQMKRAMVAAHMAGLTPLIQLHDELGFSVNSVSQCLLARDCMVDAVRLRVPVLVDMDAGESWGKAKYPVEEIFK